MTSPIRIGAMVDYFSADELIFYDLCQEYNGERELWETLKPICRRVLEEGRGD